jgi:hypothetical protein
LCLMAAVAPAGADYKYDYSRYSRHNAGTAHAISRPDNPARAISRYNAATMTCAEVQSRIQAEGAVVMHFRSSTNPSMQRFGRFVAGGGSCKAGTTAAFSASIPTADTNSCAVKECQISR